MPSIPMMTGHARWAEHPNICTQMYVIGEQVGVSVSPRASAGARPVARPVTEAEHGDTYNK